VRLIGTAKDKASVLSFVLKGYETEEVGQALNEEGIAVRSTSLLLHRWKRDIESGKSCL